MADRPGPFYVSFQDDPCAGMKCACGAWLPGPKPGAPSGCRWCGAWWGHPDDGE